MVDGKIHWIDGSHTDGKNLQKIVKIDVWNGSLSKDPERYSVEEANSKLYGRNGVWEREIFLKVNKK
jgi:hypothetical protein